MYEEGLISRNIGFFSRRCYFKSSWKPNVFAKRMISSLIQITNSEDRNGTRFLPDVCLSSAYKLSNIAFERLNRCWGIKGRLCLHRSHKEKVWWRYVGEMTCTGYLSRNTAILSRGGVVSSAVRLKLNVAWKRVFLNWMLDSQSAVFFLIKMLFSAEETHFHLDGCE